MDKTARQLLQQAEEFQKAGSWLAAARIAREAAARGGGAEAGRLAQEGRERAAAVYGAGAVAGAKAYCAALLDGSRRFAITRNTATGAGSGNCYACPRLTGSIYLTDAGLGFCPTAPALACAPAQAASQLSVLRLSVELIQSDLVLNNECLCGHCPHLQKMPLAEAKRSYGPLKVHLEQTGGHEYDPVEVLRELSRRGLLAPGRQQAGSGQVGAASAVTALREIMGILAHSGLPGAIRTDPEVFSADVLEALARNRAEVICEISEVSGEGIWKQIQAYCRAGRQNVTVKLIFKHGGLSRTQLDAFMANCLAAGCRRIGLAFNERLTADDLLLDSKEYLERKAKAAGLELVVDKDSLDAVIFNRKSRQQRAQSDWSPERGGPAGHGRFRAGKGGFSAFRAVGQN